MEPREYSHKETTEYAQHSRQTRYGQFISAGWLSAQAALSVCLAMIPQLVDFHIYEEDDKLWAIYVQHGGNGTIHLHHNQQ